MISTTSGRTDFQQRQLTAYVGRLLSIAFPALLLVGVGVGSGHSAFTLWSFYLPSWLTWTLCVSWCVICAVVFTILALVLAQTAHWLKCLRNHPLAGDASDTLHDAVRVPDAMALTASANDSSFVPSLEENGLSADFSDRLVSAIMARNTATSSGHLVQAERDVVRCNLEVHMNLEKNGLSADFSDRFVSANMARITATSSGHLVQAEWDIVRCMLEVHMKSMTPLERSIFVHYSVLERIPSEDRSFTPSLGIPKQGIYLDCLIPGTQHEGIYEIVTEQPDNEDDSVNDETVFTLVSHKYNFQAFTWTANSPASVDVYPSQFGGGSTCIKRVSALFPSIPHIVVTRATLCTRGGFDGWNWFLTE